MYVLVGLGFPTICSTVYIAYRLHVTVAATGLPGIPKDSYFKDIRLPFYVCTCALITVLLGLGFPAICSTVDIAYRLHVTVAATGLTGRTDR